MLNASLSWIDNMHFECNNDGLVTAIDAPADHGGGRNGPTPKELILNAMMGCTAMDVVAILKKMRLEIGEFKMSIEAEKTTDHPVHFKTATMIYHLKGDLPAEKVIKAVDSSLTRYCGVNYMISKTCVISYKVFVNDTEIKTGTVEFAP